MARSLGVAPFIMAALWLDSLQITVLVELVVQRLAGLSEHHFDEKEQRVKTSISSAERRICDGREGCENSPIRYRSTFGAITIMMVEHVKY